MNERTSIKWKRVSIVLSKCSLQIWLEFLSCVLVRNTCGLCFAIFLCRSTSVKLKPAPNGHVRSTCDFVLMKWVQPYL